SFDKERKEGAAAIAIAKEVGYNSVGTVEFLLDKDHHFYFMEVNTRIQVEHTVTEDLTGVDLVKEQIKIAMGEKLSIRQKDVNFEGHVIQFRINAENPSNQFSPSPGQLEYYLPPGGPHVRVDSACYSGYKIPPNYDSMIAKLIVRGKTREEAIQIGKRALKEFHIGGVYSTIPFHQYLLQDENFIEGTSYDLAYIDDLMADGCVFDLDLQD
ncbi:Biotin carboxylase, partial [Waddlia chondrophila 2032/99]